MTFTKTILAAGKVFNALLLLLLIAVLHFNPVTILLGWLIGSMLELAYFWWRES